MIQKNLKKVFRIFARLLKIFLVYWKQRKTNEFGKQGEHGIQSYFSSGR